MSALRGFSLCLLLPAPPALFVWRAAHPAGRAVAAYRRRIYSPPCAPAATPSPSRCAFATHPRALPRFASLASVLLAPSRVLAEARFARFVCVRSVRFARAAAPRSASVGRVGASFGARLGSARLGGEPSGWVPLRVLRLASRAALKAVAASRRSSLYLPSSPQNHFSPVQKRKELEASLHGCTQLHLLSGATRFASRPIKLNHHK